MTPEGLPLAYEVLAGNTSDKTTLRDFLGKIERQYGKARRIWLSPDREPPRCEVRSGRAISSERRHRRLSESPEVVCRKRP